MKFFLLRYNMKTTLQQTGILLSLFILIACQSHESARYNAIMDKAEKSPVTEIETPDGFRFDMAESEFDEAFFQRESHFTDSLTKFRYGPLIARYDWPLGTEHYAVGKTYSKDFRDNKLCSYEIEINGRIVNDRFVWMKESDIIAICDYYKAFLEKDYTFDSLNLEMGQTYVFTKNNMAITIHKVSDRNAIKVKYENRPVTAAIEREIAAFLENEKLEESSLSSVEVNNNKWNGGVKQVEDYLERTLRDPDSYESIEWSEVKQKADGYYVRHKYRAKNGFGGYVVTNQLFHLDFNGNVVDVKDLY